MYSKRSLYRRNRKTLTLFLLVFITALPLFSQEESDEDILTTGIKALDKMESWLLFEKGIYSYDQKDYGESLNFFNKLIERHGVYPEAEYWIGRVFEQEGEYLLAEKQYIKALEAERILLIPDEKYEIKYRLARLYQNRGNYDSYVQILNSIVVDELKVNQLALANEIAAINTLKRAGIDRAVLLFRHELTYSVDAFNQLGVYYYKTGDYKSATSKLVYPLFSLFSIAVDFLRNQDPEFVYPEGVDVLLNDYPDYVFSTLEKIVQRKDETFLIERNMVTLEVLNTSGQYQMIENLLPEAPEFYLSGASFCLTLFNKEPSLKNLVEEYNLFQNMYYLAASLYAEGYSETAFRIWEIVHNDLNSQMWGKKAYQQLLNPEVEIGLTVF